MALDLVTTAYRTAAAYSRSVPRPVADLTAKALSRAAATVSAERRMLVARHLRRARPELEGRALDKAVDATFDSYARYWIDSFRLPRLLGGRGRPPLRRRGLPPRHRVGRGRERARSSPCRTSAGGSGPASGSPR